MNGLKSMLFINQYKTRYETIFRKLSNLMKKWKKNHGKKARCMILGQKVAEKCRKSARQKQMRPTVEGAGQGYNIVPSRRCWHRGLSLKCFATAKQQKFKAALTETE